MLLQRAAYLGAVLVSHPNERAQAKAELAIVANLIESEHENPGAPQLYEGAHANGASARALRQVYYAEPHQLDARIDRFIAHTRALTAASISKQTMQNLDFIELRQSLDSVIEAQDAALKQKQVVFAEEYAKLHSTNRLRLIALIVGLSAIGILSYPALARRVRENIDNRAEEISDAQFQSLAEASPLGIYLNDDQGGCIYTNPRWQQITGLSYDEALGDGWLKMMHPDDLELMATEWNGALESDSEFDLKFRIRRPDGEIRWIHTRAASVRVTKDSATAAVGSFQDITEQRAAEIQLSRSEERFALALRGTQDGLWEWAIGGDVYYSPRYEELLGFTTGALPPSLSTFEERLHPDDKDSILARIENHLETREPYKAEYRLRMKNDVYRWFSAGGQAVWDESGNPIRMAGSIRDISERRKMEQDLRLTQTAVDKAAEIVFWTDTTGRLIYSNDAAQSGLGYAETEMFGLRMSDIDRSLGDETWQSNANKMTEDGVTNRETDFRRRDGSVFPVALIENFVEFEQRQFIVCFAIDITERRRVEEAERRNTAELEIAKAAVEAHAKQLESHTEALTRSNEELEQFAFISSHDLQEPLRKIQSFGDRLQRNHSEVLDEDGSADLARIRGSAKRMQTLIEDLLLYSRVGRDDIEVSSVDLNQILSGVAYDLEESIANASARLEIPDLPIVDANPTQMRQLFQNLIGNAVKFRSPDRDPVVAIRTLETATGDRVEFHVVDNGIGIDQKYAAKIFKPFQRLHGRDKFEGTGIGLAIVAKIVDRYDGDIKIVASEGGGTTFVFSLPLAQSAQTQNGVAALA